jgi:hypothetical protein
VRIERPGSERAEGGAVDAATRLRFLSAGFGTGYVPATAAYRYEKPEAGEPDADLDPLFSGGGMRIVQVGGEKALPGVMAALRRAGAGGGIRIGGSEDKVGGSEGLEFGGVNEGAV